MRSLALSLCITILAVAPVASQVTVSSAVDFLAAPADRVVGTVNAGARVTPGASRQGFTQVTLEGFVDSTLLGAARDSFPRTVRAPSGALLRAGAATDAAILAKLSDGAGVTVVSRTGRWARVRRTGWVMTRALAPAPAAAARGALPTAAGAVSAAPPGDGSTPVAVSSAIAPRQPLPLQAGPEGRELATVNPGTPMTPLAREGAWTRVRVEGWVRDAETVPADSSIRMGLTAADLRADPDGTKGTVIQWDVQYMALQTADAARRDLRPNEPYLLVRGPGAEDALLYIAVPPALLADVRSLQPLGVISITARVRSGRSAPSGVPLLDLLSLVRR